MTIACGVDFGTSNSTVGWSPAAQPEMLLLEDGRVTLPSVIFFDAEEDRVSYGRAALANYLTGCEGRMMRSMKSLLGTSLIDGHTEVMGRSLSMRALLAQFIAELKRRAESGAGRSFDFAVFGRPVHFVDDDAAADQKAQDTLRDIALAAGYREVGFQYEPIAAAFDYESRIAREELVLIADIGGGTSDFSLIRLSPERARKTDRRADILASGGIHIGGTDFDKYLSLSCVMPQLGLGTKLKNNAEMPSTCYFNLATWHTINLAYTQRVERELLELARDAREPARLDLLLQLIRQRGGHWMALQVEAAKIALCDNGAATLTLDRLRPVLVQPLARPDFDAAIAHLTASVEHSVRAMLREAGVDASQVDTIFFTGGSSAVPLLRQKIAAAAPMARQAEGDLFKSIGAGLALDAARRFT